MFSSVMVLDLVVALLLGSMIIFAAVIAPSVFKLLEAEQAGIFLRGLFPRFYLWGAVMSVLALLLSLWTSPANILLVAIVLLGFVYSRQFLTKRINAARDRWLASDAANDKIAFDRLHKQSVMINLIQMFLLLVIIVFYFFRHTQDY